MTAPINKTKAIIIIFFVFAFAFLSNTKEINAQQELPLIVAPARQYLSADPGTKHNIAVKFFNSGKDPVFGNIKVVDFIVTGSSGSPTLLEEETAILSSRFSGANWTTLPFDKATIAAESVLNIQFELNIPDDARPGGRYLAVLFEPTGSIPQPEGVETEGIVAVSPRIVGLVNIRINGPISEQAVIRRFETPSFIEYGPIDVVTEIYNRGDYHITPAGSIKLYNWMGRMVDEEELKSLNIFPDASRTYENKLGGKLLIGKYKLILTATYGESGQVITSSSSFWAFPWKVVLLAVLTVIIIILLVILTYQKIKGRQRKLEEKLEEEISEIETLKAKYKDTVTTLTSKKQK